MRFRYSLSMGLATLALLTYSFVPRTVLVQQGIRNGRVQVVVDRMVLWKWCIKSAGGVHAVRTQYVDDGPTPFSGPADGLVDTIHNSGIQVFGQVISKPAYKERLTAPAYRASAKDREYNDADRFTSEVLKSVQSQPYEVIDAVGEVYKTWRFNQWY